MKKLIVSLIVLAFVAIPASANMVTEGGFEYGDTGDDNWIAWDGTGSVWVRQLFDG